MAVSAGLHGTVLFLCFLSWLSPFHASNNAVTTVLPVELVTIGDETNVAATVQRQLPLPPSTEQGAPPQPAAPQIEMKYFPQADQPNHHAASPAQETPPAPPAEKATAGPRDAIVADHNIKAVGDADAMTLSVRDALRNQIARCWRTADLAASGPVRFDLVLDPDGAVAEPPRLNGAQDRAAGDAIAEAVRYAIYTCAPYHLPRSRFSEWHKVTLLFDPAILSKASE